MREKRQKQTPLISPATDHPQARELEAISAILKKHPTIEDTRSQDHWANPGSQGQKIADRGKTMG